MSSSRRLSRILPSLKFAFPLSSEAKLQRIGGSWTRTAVLGLLCHVVLISTLGLLIAVSRVPLRLLA